jgi:3-oxoacyl-[acyl-carrier-protein] synthase-1
MSADVQIVAAGARAPVGTTAESVAAAVRAGISRVRRVQVPELGRKSDSYVALDGLLDPHEWGAAARMAVLGAAALAEVIGKLVSVAAHLNAEVPVLVGLPEERPGWEAAEAPQVVAALGAVGGGGLRLRIEPRLSGHAAALEGLQEAVTRVGRAGRCPLVIVGGIDSYLDIETLAWLRENNQWLEEGSRTGFAPGEAAAFVALMAASEARRLGLTPTATVRAAAIARETRLINMDDLNLGEGLTAAVSKALAPLDGTRETVENIHCDINGDRYRSEEWGFVALRLGASFRDASAYHTPVRSCGDVGAATGALNLVMSAQAWRRGYARGPRALVWGSSDAGLRAAALLEEPNPERGGGTRLWAR